MLYQECATLLANQLFITTYNDVRTNPSMYIPSQTEILLLVSLTALAALVYSIGGKIFSLSGETTAVPHHQATAQPE